MRFYTLYNRKKFKSLKDKLTSLDRVILEKCNDSSGINIIRLLKAGKPYTNKFGKRQFATTDEVMASVNKLQRLGVLEGR